jgi:hypothetical protein
MELMDHAIGRFRGYPRVLECAQETPLLERGDPDSAQPIIERVKRERRAHAVTAATELSPLSPEPGIAHRIAWHTAADHPEEVARLDCTT